MPALTARNTAPGTDLDFSDGKNIVEGVVLIDPGTGLAYGATPVRGTLTAGLATALTTGGTAQNVLAANSSRLGFAVQNLHPTADLWLSTLATAVQDTPSIRVLAGELYEPPPGGQGTGALSLIGPTTGQKFTVREW